MKALISIKQLRLKLQNLNLDEACICAGTEGPRLLRALPVVKSSAVVGLKFLISFEKNSGFSLYIGPHKFCNHFSGELHSYKDNGVSTT